MSGFAAHRTVFERSLHLSAAKQKQFFWHWVASVSMGDNLSKMPLSVSVILDQTFTANRGNDPVWL